MNSSIIEYIHIPKCGGTFVKNLVYNGDDESADSELSCKAYRKKHGGDCAKLHRPYSLIANKNKIFIAVVRDPYTRLKSNYHYDIENWKTIFGENNCDTFEKFVDFLHKNPEMIYSHIHLYPQTYFLTVNNQISPNILLFAFNELPHNIFYFLKNSMQLPIRNVNYLKQYNTQENINYNMSSVEFSKISQLYKDDIRLLASYF